MRLLETILLRFQKKTNFFNKRKDVFSLDVMSFFYVLFLGITIFERLIKYIVYNKQYSNIAFFIIPISLTVIIVITILVTRHVYKRKLKKNSKTKIPKKRIDTFLAVINVVIITLLLETEWLEINQISPDDDKNYYWLGEQLAILFTATAFILRSELYLFLMTLYYLIYPYIRFFSYSSSAISGTAIFFKMIPLIAVIKLDRIFYEKFEDLVSEKTKEGKISKKVLDVLPEGVCILDKTGLIYKNNSLKLILDEEEPELLLKKIFAIENEELNKSNKKKFRDIQSQFISAGVSNHKTEFSVINFLDKESQKKDFMTSSKIINDKIKGTHQKSEKFYKQTSLESKFNGFDKESKKVKILDSETKQSTKEDKFLKKGKTDFDTKELSDKHFTTSDEEPKKPLQNSDKGYKRIQTKLENLIDTINQPYFKLDFATVEDAVNHMLAQLENQFPDTEFDDGPIPSLEEMNSRASFKARTLTGNRYVKSLSVASTYCTMFIGKIVNEAETKNVEIKFTPLIFSGSNSIMVLIRDITEKEKFKQLKKEDDNKIRALAAISHEFRTPLNGIIVMLELLKTKVTKDIYNATVTPAINSAKLLLFLVNDILDLHQIREGKQIIVPKLFNFKAAVHECLDLITIQAKNKGLNLVNQYDNDVDEMLINDPNRVKQILNNLLSNALKFTLQGSITVKIEKISENRRIVQVIDTGIGIPKEKIHGILGELGKIESSINRELNPQGVGLGLSITNKLAKLVCSDEGEGGLIVTSIYGKGSCFSFYVDNFLDEKPSFEADDDYRLTIFEKMNDIYKSDNILSPGNEDSFPMFRGGQKLYSKMSFRENDDADHSTAKRIKSDSSDSVALIVDDNDFNLIALGSLLKLFGFQFITAYNGEQAMNILKEKQGQFNIIFLDIEMPIMDGTTCAKQMREYLKNRHIQNLPIIGVTGNSSSEQHSAYLNSGMDDILVKPVFQNSIKDILHKWSFVS